MDFNEAIESARLAAVQGDKYKARSMLRKIIKAQPRNEAAWLLFADVAEKPEHAIQCLERVIKLNPNNEVAQDKLAKYRNKDTQPILNVNTTTPRISRKFIGIVGAGIFGICLVGVIAVFLLFGNSYTPNPGDAFSYATGYALSEMHAKRPSSYGCVETENKKAVHWYRVKITDLGNGKYYIIGAMKAIDEFCIYNTGYFTATVFYDYEIKDWRLADKAYFSNQCMTLSHKASTSDLTNCTLWKYDWSPDMNWRPPQ